MRILAFIPVLAVAACVDSSMPTEVTGGAATASHMLNEKTDVLSMPVVACNGEVVDLSGTAHTIFDFGFDSEGGFIYRFSVDYKLEGIGSVTGAKYEGKERLDDRVKVKDDDSKVSSEVRMHLVGQGKVPDMDMLFKVKTVVVNGELKHEQTESRSVCK